MRFDVVLGVGSPTSATAYIGGRHYLSLIGNYAVHDNDFFNLFNGQHVWGGSFGYAYNSIAGPVNAQVGLSNRNTNLQFYLNVGYCF